MCGIVGTFDLRGQGRASAELTRAMCAAIHHRGPDGDGFYDEARGDLRLGMRRLSIIDVDGSDQPLFNEDQSLALVFNGEIYNYRELRADLTQRGHALRTAGDGETILHLYEEYGTSLFRHLRGMYAFALWDGKARQLLLAVDHIGMKPLYLRESDGLLHFASEVKALLCADGAPRRLHLPLLDSYLSFGFPISEQTLFDGVRRLLPGHALLLSDQGQQLIRHWAYDDPQACYGLSDGLPHDETALIGEVERRLRESVALHLRSDVPLGLFLSGGVDSAATLALMSQVVGRVQTYTVGFEAPQPDHEVEQARRIAVHFGAQHHERIIRADEWWEGLRHYAHAHDEPNANPSAVSMLLLSEMTARHVKVVLTGLGGDELFGGYGHHRQIPRLLAGLDSWGRAVRPFMPLLRQAEAAYPRLKRWRIVGALPTYLPRVAYAAYPRDEALRRAMSFDGLAFNDAWRARLYGEALLESWRAGHTDAAYAPIIARSLRPDGRDTAQALVINTWLMGNALLSQDKVTMAHSLEARVPFFDPALLEMAAQLPSELRLRSNKYLLRQAMRPHLPTWALERPKHGFSTPIRSWFNQALRLHIEGTLLDSPLLRCVLRSEALERLVQSHFCAAEQHDELLLRLLNLALWAEAFQVTA
ncbi:MAG: asparagine synthase (glutamine-hydrolyzing) [Anaerolineae bacterium]|nr:asparagine synthase (glutamine-hydrolyzing) [Anaerolineae bacterium]MDW8173694.1 asparagine synthase (glutamine-hydrolyzing) [Anaerolineae bacterium]